MQAFLVKFGTWLLETKAGRAVLNWLLKPVKNALLDGARKAYDKIRGYFATKKFEEIVVDPNKDREERKKGEDEFINS